MTVDERFERNLPTVLTDLYLGPTPDYRDDLLWQTARTSQRPAWSFPGRWLPMADLATERVNAPRIPWRIVGVALVIIALLIAGTVAFVGSQQPKLPPPFGVAHNGLIAFEQAGDIVTLDPKTATTHVLVGGPEQDSAPVYSSDGTKVAFRARRRRQRPGDLRRQLRWHRAGQGDAGPDRRPARLDLLARWSCPPRDGDRLRATADVRGRERWLPARANPRTWTSRPTPNAVEAPRLSPDGRFAGPGGRVVAWCAVSEPVARSTSTPAPRRRWSNRRPRTTSSARTGRRTASGSRMASSIRPPTPSVAGARHGGRRYR